MWRIGLGHAIFWKYRLSEALTICSEVGVDIFEIWTDHPDVYPAIEDPTYIRVLIDEISKYSLEITVHGPCHDVNLASANPGIRRESLRQALSALRIASELGSRIIVFHPGRRTTRYISDSIFMRNSIESLKIITREALDMGLTICIENMENAHNQFAVKPETILEILHSVEYPNVGIVFDAAHANTYGDPIEYYKQIKEHVIHIHLSNNYGKTSPKVHMPLYEGTLDIRKFLETLYNHRYQGRIVIEGGGCEDIKACVARNTTYLRSIISNLITANSHT